MRSTREAGLRQWSLFEGHHPVRMTKGDVGGIRAGSPDYRDHFTLEGGPSKLPLRRGICSAEGIPPGPPALRPTNTKVAPSLRFVQWPTTRTSVDAAASAFRNTMRPIGLWNSMLPPFAKDAKDGAPLVLGCVGKVQR